MELAIAGSIAGTAEVVQPRQHRQQAVKVFETAQIPLGEIGFLGCHRPPPANMTVLSCCRKQRANSVPNRGARIQFLFRVPSVFHLWLLTNESKMPNIKIAVLNPSTVVPDADVKAALPAFQSQVSDDFAPVWGIDASLRFLPSGSKPAAGEWWLSILDDSDQAGALGYHDLTKEGLPLGKVFAKSDIDNGYIWTVTASHELLEMLGDPDINLTAFVQKTNDSGRLYAYEVCDACEADKFG